MKPYLKAGLFTFVVAMVLVGLFWQWSQSTLPEGAQKVYQIEEMETTGLPEFELPNLEGKTVKLSDFKGKVVIVSFWASWCGPCLEEFPSMIALIEKMNGSVQLIAISEDSERGEIDAFLNSFPKSKNPHIHILWDADHKVSQQYDAERLPESFIAGKDQKLVRRIVGSIDWATEDAISYMTNLIKK